MAEIAIVGGGPSGAMCGEQLARAGHKVQIFDEHLAWEKPCGGGLTYKAYRDYPFLIDSWCIRWTSSAATISAHVSK
jgi:flavin-dependent dehydrogenase